MPVKTGGYIFTVDGLFELFSGEIASFITKLDESKNAICMLDSAETRVEQELIPGARSHAGHCVGYASGFFSHQENTERPYLCSYG